MGCSVSNPKLVRADHFPASNVDIINTNMEKVDDSKTNAFTNNNSDKQNLEIVDGEKAKNITKDESSKAVVAEKDSAKASAPAPKVLTEEEAENLIAECHEKILVIKEQFDLDNYRNTDDIRKAILKLKEDYYFFKHAGVKRALDYRRRVAVDMIDNGVCRMLCQIIMQTLNEGWLNEAGQIDTNVYNPFTNSFTVVFNFSDASPELGVEFCRIENFLETLIETLKSFYKRGVKQEEALHQSDYSYGGRDQTGPGGQTDGSTKLGLTITDLAPLVESFISGRTTAPTLVTNLTEAAFIRSGLGLLHNCANVEENKAHLRRLGLSSVLFAFMNNSKIEKHRLCAVLGLSDILTEEESKALQADTDGVKFLLRRLRIAVDDVQLRSMGWSAKELARGIEKLANNDINKKMLVDNGVLPTLNSMCRLDGADEQNAAVGALLALSFADSNKEKIIEEEGLIAHLNDLQKTSTDEGTRRSAERTLWNLRDMLKVHSEYKKLGMTLCRMERGDSSPAGSHIMISYNWDHQNILLKVRDALRHLGYRTWMDVDNMEGSTLDAMAKAVENSAAVLICMSQQYKDSQFCRMEFEYAFKCKKLLVPLVMQPGYKPDGWLGLVIGNTLYHDFSGKHTFESRLDNVAKALGGKGKAGAPGVGAYDLVDAPIVHEPIVPAVDTKLGSAPIKYHVAAPTETSAVSGWSSNDVKVWLRDNSLTNNSRLAKLTGPQLVFLWDLKVEAPEYFYRYLESQLKLQNLADLMSFTTALKQLFK